MNKVITDLRELLSEEQVITEVEVLKENSQDYVGFRRFERYFGDWKNEPGICIAKVRNTEEVSTVMKYMNENHVVSIPVTGRSSVTRGIETSGVEVVVDASDMNEIVKIDEVNMQVTVKCGVPLEYLENVLNDQGYTTGHYPQSLPMACIGGLVATRSTGQFSTLYGGIEELVTGMEVVMPNGEIIRIKDVPRRATGPDHKHVFIGSEGTLGFITEITMKMFKFRPDDRWLGSYAVKSMQAGLDIIRKIIVEGYKPATIRLHDKEEGQLSYPEIVNEDEAILLFVADGPKQLNELTGKIIDQIAMENGARDLGTKAVEHWLIHRNDVCDSMSDEENEYARAGAIADTCEISANWSAIGKIYDNVTARAKTLFGGNILIGGHSSHSYLTGTNIYFIFMFPVSEGSSEAEKMYVELLRVIMEETLKLGGSIAHHHGTGRYRAPWMEQEHGSSYQVLQGLKKQFDPNNIMNRGCLFMK